MTSVYMLPARYWYNWLCRRGSLGDLRCLDHDYGVFRRAGQLRSCWWNHRLRSIHAHRNGGESALDRLVDRSPPHIPGPSGWFCGRCIILVRQNRLSYSNSLGNLRICLSLANIFSMATLTAHSAELTALLKDKPGRHSPGVEVGINIAFIVLTTFSHCLGVKVSLHGLVITDCVDKFYSYTAG